MRLFFTVIASVAFVAVRATVKADECLPLPTLTAQAAPLTLTLIGQTNFNYAIESTTDFQTWTRHSTNRSSSGTFTLAEIGGESHRFFRALEVAASDGRGAFWLFNGATDAGWTPDPAFRIENCAFTGGSLDSPLPVNHFLSTTRTFTNFVLRLKFKLTGIDGFINGGVQFRSVRQAGGSVSGYQADIGPDFWGSLYDENRRNVVLAAANQASVQGVLKVNDWNHYMIRAEGSRIQLYFNGLKTVDYLEADTSIPRFGVIALQIHSDTRAEASYKEISIEEL
jgi:hypothetical protein